MGSNLQSQWWQEFYLLGICVAKRGIAKAYLLWASINIIFWEDVWLREVPLELIFHEPTRILSSRKMCGLERYHRTLSSHSHSNSRAHVIVLECWDGEELNINFRRAFDRGKWINGKNYTHVIRGVAKWPTRWDKMAKSIKQSTRSMYRLLKFEGIKNKRMNKLWKCL